MHLPSDFLNPGPASALIGAAAGVLSAAVAKVRSRIIRKINVSSRQLATEPQTSSTTTATKITDDGMEKIYSIAALAALIFALQMVNFPIAGGTSGHFIGAALAFFVLGPGEALIAISIVIIVQAALFADGGWLAVGANIFNMGILTTAAAYALHKLIKNKKFNYLKIITAAFISVITAATAVSVEMAISGTTSLSLVLPVMLKYHIIVGLAEGAITAIIIFFLAKYHYKLWL